MMGEQQQPIRMLRRREVARQVGYSEHHLDWLEAHGKFPRRVKMGVAVAWVEREIQAYLKAKIAARDAELAEKVKAKRAEAEEAEAEEAEAQKAEAEEEEAEPAEVEPA